MTICCLQCNKCSTSNHQSKLTTTATRDAAETNLVISRADANHYLSVIENLSGFSNRALDYTRRAIEDADSVGYLYGKILAHSSQALSYFMNGAFDMGREACQQGLSLLGQMSAWRMAAYLDVYCAMNELEMGLIGQAWKHAQHAIDLGRKYEHGEIMSLGYGILGDIHLNLSNFKKALQAYDQGSVAAGEHFIRCGNLFRRGYCLVRQGDETGMVLIQIETILDELENGLEDAPILFEWQAFWEKHQQPGKNE